MLAIKLKRIGKKHHPGFRIIVAEKRSKLKGPPVEDVGSYNPLRKAIAVEKERIDYWLKAGAQPTATVHNLFVQHGVIDQKKIPIHIRRERKGTKEPEAEIKEKQKPQEKKHEAGKEEHKPEDSKEIKSGAEAEPVKE